MIKDLQGIGSFNQPIKRKSVVNEDARIATEIVGSIFRCVNICLKYNKSKKEISPFAKTVISALLTDKTRNGLDDYLLNMDDVEVVRLLDEIQISLNKRRKNVDKSCRT